MKDKIISILFVLYLTIFLILNIVIKDAEISTSERRKLKQFPSFSVSNILNKSFVNNFDDYTLDQFVFRDKFRSIKANLNYKIFGMLDNNKIYIEDGYIFQINETDEKSINNFVNIINTMIDNFNSNNKVYLMIIPDKNYYINNEIIPNIDYNFLYKKVNENINISNIDIRNILSISDYYRTDSHWKQDSLIKIANVLGEKMNIEIDEQYKKNTINDFYGVYYGQASLNFGSDSITYLTNTNIINAKVNYLENKKLNSVYTFNDSLDKYDVFLNGASSFIEINNELCNNNRELIVFRDSFASSLVPLLISSYSKITLIDTRYINSENYLKLINYNNQDILFLYSSMMINNSYTLKK